tara:strand:- start:182 stop:1705 length:1524 start_codon:yes stop_codon:yes gene_type:complete
MSIFTYSQKTNVENNLREVQNTMTGSAGGWPSDTHAGIITCYDFTIEESTNQTKIFEYNTNINSLHSSELFPTMWDTIAHHIGSQSGYDNVVIYGSTGFGLYNPPLSNQNNISSSFANLNLSSSFNYNDYSQYLSMRGDSNEANTFHIFVKNPEHRDDTLFQMVSCSFDKLEFRSFLGTHHSDYLIDSYTSSSKSANSGVGNYPDYVVKNNKRDASLMGNLEGSIQFNSYLSNREAPVFSASYLDESNTEQWVYERPGEQHYMSSQYSLSIEAGLDTYAENFTISSGSIDGTKRFLGNGRASFFSTPTNNIPIGSYYDSKFLYLKPPTGEFLSSPTESLDYTWKLKAYNGPSTPSGSNIRMYDGSTTQVQDIQVGDVVKSYQPIGLPDSDIDFHSYSVSDLGGSYATGSVVTGISSNGADMYIFVNSTYKIPQLGSVFVNRLGLGSYQFVKGYQLQVGDELYSQDASWIEVTSVAEVFEPITFYSLDVEDIDTYFSSDILVHNIPKK